MNNGRNAVLAFLASFLSLAASAQSDNASIRGTIYGPQGEAVPYLSVQAKEAETGEFERSESSTEGQYDLGNLAPGSYIIEVATPCCAYVPFESELIELAAGESKAFEIHLEEGDSFNTVGDDPGNIAALLRREAQIPDEPPPHLASGRPDLSGVWIMGNDPFPGEDREAFEWAQEMFEERGANFGINHPHLRCLPGDPPIGGGAAPFISKFVQKEELLVILFEDVPGFRQVFIDGRDLPVDPNPAWMGHSIGRWDGDELVIDTIGFNDRGWMFGFPRSEELRLEERYSRPEYGRLDLELTVEDPKVFKAPWVRNIPLYLTPQVDLLEYVCENNKWFDVSSEE